MRKGMKQRTRQKLYIFWRACLAACLPLLLVAVMFASTASSWFYFPNPKAVSLITAPAVPMDLHVWRLSNDGIPVESVAVTDTDLDKSIIPIDLTMNFFQWGNEFFCEGADTVYYAFDLTYDSDVFFTGSTHLPLVAEFSADMTYSARTEAGQPYVTPGSDYLRFPFYTVSYAIGQDAGVGFEGHTALHEAQNASYTDLISLATIEALAPTGAETEGTLHGAYSDDLSTLAPARYKQVVTVEDGQVNRLRLVVYVRIQANEPMLNEKLQGNVSMADTMLELDTSLTLKAELRTIPAYTGE